MSNKKQLSEEEKKELRRKQQEKAMQFQSKINDNIKNSYQELHSKSKVDNTTEKDNETDEEEKEEKKQDINEFDDLKLVNDRFDQMMIDEKKAKENDEEYNKMFDDMLKEYDKNIDRKNNESISKEIEKKLKHSSDSQKSKKSVKWSDENLNKIAEIERVEYDSDDYDEEQDEDDDYEEYDTDEEQAEENVKVESAPITLYIKHTKTAELEEIDRKLKISREKPEINSPGDIYAHFYKPKSILKSSSTTSISSDEMKSFDNDNKDSQVQKEEPKNAELGKFEPEKVRIILKNFPFIFINKLFKRHFLERLSKE